MSKNDSLNGTTLPLRKIRQRESAVPKHRYRRYQIADIINVLTLIDIARAGGASEAMVNHIRQVQIIKEALAC